MVFETPTESRHYTTSQPIAIKRNEPQAISSLPEYNEFPSAEPSCGSPQRSFHPRKQSSEFNTEDAAYLLDDFEAQISEEKICYIQHFPPDIGSPEIATIVPTRKNIQGKWKGAGAGLGVGVGAAVGFAVGGIIGFAVLGGVGAVIGRAVGKRRGEVQERKYFATHDLSNIKTFPKMIKCKASHCTLCPRKFQPPMLPRGHCALCGNSFCPTHIPRRAYVKFDDERKLKFAKVCEHCWRDNTPRQLHGPLPLSHELSPAAALYNSSLSNYSVPTSSSDQNGRGRSYSTSASDCVNRLSNSPQSVHSPLSRTPQ